MFDIDSIFNYVIFLIPIAILINRFIRRAKAKNAPPPAKPPPPRVPVHFEDDDDDEFAAYFKNRNAEVEDAPKRVQAPSPPRRKVQKNVAVPFTQKPEFSGGSQPPVVMARPVLPVAPRREFSFDLNHLSPLKQAVIMSEILGEPRGMRQIGEER